MSSAMPAAYAKFFPKPSFYPNQKEAMDKIYGALLAGHHVLFEGACGTGKTLSALAPALASGGKKIRKSSSPRTCTSRWSSSSRRPGRSRPWRT